MLLLWRQLTPQIEQATLNITFTRGEVVMFEITGDK
jgi:hypothetical protein